MNKNERNHRKIAARNGGSVLVPHPQYVSANRGQTSISAESMMTRTIPSTHQARVSRSPKVGWNTRSDSHPTRDIGRWVNRSR